MGKTRAARRERIELGRSLDVKSVAAEAIRAQGIDDHEHHVRRVRRRICTAPREGRNVARDDAQQTNERARRFDQDCSSTERR